MPSSKQLSKIFDDCAKGYEKHATMQQEVAHRMLGRLQYIKMKPELILDCGCATGVSTLALRKQYPKAKVIGVDISMSMLNLAKTKQAFWQKKDWLCADVAYLPFASQSVDLIFANQLLHWLPDVELFFAECLRILKPHGCLMFSTLGPDTLKEFKQAFLDIETGDFPHVESFVDMHNIGDELLKQQFSDPVMDREDLQLTYASMSQLLSALRAQGVKNRHPQRARGLMSRQRWQKMLDVYPKQGQRWPVSYEVVYGQAWRPQSIKQRGEQVISMADLKLALKKTKQLPSDDTHDKN
jgi:malonyl-CoA O-methyltransferase